MTDATPPGHHGTRRPVEALRAPGPAPGADEIATTDPVALASHLRRSALDRTSSPSPTPDVPHVPAGGSDPYADTADPTELANRIPRRRF